MNKIESESLKLWENDKILIKNTDIISGTQTVKFHMNPKLGLIEAILKPVEFIIEDPLPGTIMLPVSLILTGTALLFSPILIF